MQNLIDKAEALLQALKDNGVLESYPEAFDLFLAITSAKMASHEE